MPCRRAHFLALQSRPASSAFPRPCRTVYTHVRVSKGEDLGPTRDNAHQTLRIRQDTNARALPLPPLLDPVVLEKRSRWQNVKAQPKPADFTPFQKKLQANPFAHALASPVRQCRASRILLPVAFLTELHARPHPATKDPWLLPVSLTSSQKHLGPPYRFLGSRLVATYLGKKKTWMKGLYPRLEEKHGGSIIKKMVWRDDMPGLILDLMQTQVVKKLSWNFGFRGRLIPVASPRPEDIEHVEDVECVLIVRTLRTRASVMHSRAAEVDAEMEKWSSYVAKSFVDKLDPHALPEVTHQSPVWYNEPLVPRLQPRILFPPLEFHTTVWRGAKVALYSLTDLLGADKAQDLVDRGQYAGEGCLVVKRARHNVPIGILLMRLQAYIARPGP